MANLTLAQKQTLKAAILADPTLAALAASFEYSTLADALNANASPDFYVWKSLLYLHEVTDKVSPTGTSFTWGGTAGGYINRSQGERDCWQQLWNTSLSCNPSALNVRAAFNDIFSGAGAGAVNNRAHLDACAKRLASRTEKVFAAGAGTSGSPALLVVEGIVNPQEIGSIMAS